MIEIQCAIALIEGNPELRYAVTNTGTTSLFVLAGKRMPYVLVEDKHITVLHGVHAPDPDIDYYMIEIPSTEEWPAGTTRNFKIPLKDLQLSSHYEYEPSPGNLHGTYRLTVQFGFGDTPIPANETHNWSIEDVLKWQKLASSSETEVIFP